MTLTGDQRRALALFACDEHSTTEDLMLAHGFRDKMLEGLVLAGLATVVTETVRAGAATIKVDCYRITDAGARRARGRRVAAAVEAPLLEPSPPRLHPLPGLPAPMTA
jgi:hypothetical protein